MISLVGWNADEYHLPPRKTGEKLPQVYIIYLIQRHGCGKKVMIGSGDLDEIGKEGSFLLQ